MKPAFVLAILIFLTSSLSAQKPVEVGGALMYASKNIVENARNSKDHTTLVTAVKAAELVETLQSEGPFTVFAPVNTAFDKLAEATITNLLKPENKIVLQGVLTYHVVSGKWSAKDLKNLIKEQRGKATITTVNGGKIYAGLDINGNIWIWDENGGKAMVTTADVFQKNGVIHVIDHVLLPKK